MTSIFSRALMLKFRIIWFTCATTNKRKDKRFLTHLFTSLFTIIQSFDPVKSYVSRASSNKQTIEECKISPFCLHLCLSNNCSSSCRLWINIFLCVTQMGFCCVYFIFISDNMKKVIIYFKAKTFLNYFLLQTIWFMVKVNNKNPITVSACINTLCIMIQNYLFFIFHGRIFILSFCLKNITDN